MVGGLHVLALHTYIDCCLSCVRSPIRFGLSSTSEHVLADPFHQASSTKGLFRIVECATEESDSFGGMNSLSRAARSGSKRLCGTKNVGAGGGGKQKH